MQLVTPQHGDHHDAPAPKRVKVETTPRSALRNGKDAPLSNSKKNVSFAAEETPAAAMIKKEKKTPPPQYEDRTKYGTKACDVYNGELSRRPLWVDLETEQDESRVENWAVVKEISPYRYMFTPPTERSKALAARLKRYFDEEEEEEDFCGMVCCEGLTGKLNKQSLVIDTLSSGRLSLDLSRVVDQKWSLFPGQLIRVKGELLEDGTLFATHICAAKRRPPTTSPSSRLARFHHQRQGGQPLSIFCAAGPFTTTDNLDFKPLQDLLTAVKVTVPDVLVLCGPFVDAQHPALAQNALMVDGQFVDPHTLFMLKISWKLAALADEGLPTRVVLAPSHKDATAPNVYPCPAFRDRRNAKEPSWDDYKVGGLDIDASIATCVSNPAVVEVNELKIGISTNDALFDLATQEISDGGGDGSRVARLASHLVDQHSFYPLFPPANNTPLDLAQLEQLDMPSLDVLIVPSKLNVFANNHQHTLIVNPGPLAKGTLGGTFAQLFVHPLKNDDGSKDAPSMVAHAVPERTRVEITRI